MTLVSTGLVREHVLKLRAAGGTYASIGQAATTGAMTVGSLIKGVPAIGWAVGAVTMPALSAGATYVIGKVFIQHFASGGTLLDFNVPDYREFIKVQKEKLTAGSGAATTSAQPGPAAQSASEKAAADA